MKIYLIVLNVNQLREGFQSPENAPARFSRDVPAARIRGRQGNLVCKVSQTLIIGCMNEWSPFLSLHAVLNQYRNPRSINFTAISHDSSMLGCGIVSHPTAFSRLTLTDVSWPFLGLWSVCSPLLTLLLFLLLFFLASMVGNMRWRKRGRALDTRRHARE